MIRKIIKTTGDYLNNLLFTYRCCWGCEQIQIGQGLCSTCWKDLRFIPDNHCIFCNNHFQISSTGCVDCSYRSMAIFGYKGIICKIILQLKYGRRFYLGDFLINLLSGVPDNKEYCIIYVPHYPWKQVRISVNSSLLLAHCFKKKFGGEICHNILYKTSKQRQKDSKDYRARMENGFLNYEIQNGQYLKGRPVILIDDVTTTGSTLNACARLIQAQSPMSLLVITICKVL